MIPSKNFKELAVSAPEAAKRLLGSELVRTFADGTIARVKIVETEAYDESDPGSHTFRGRTPRNSVMFGPAGYLYVYFIYGMHYCCNVVTGPDGYGEAVLIRAVEPVEGEGLLQARRRGKLGPDITNGPAKVCLALDITKLLNGHNLVIQPLQLVLRPPVDDEKITITRRIGLTKGQETHWRFYLSNNSYTSKQKLSASSERP